MVERVAGFVGAGWNGMVLLAECCWLRKGGGGMCGRPWEPCPFCKRLGLMRSGCVAEERHCLETKMQLGNQRSKVEGGEGQRGAERSGTTTAMGKTRGQQKQMEWREGVGQR